ncbi:hypothetical protein [Haloarcula laminariae]|uniref:hypothetical protein n=1 Tax=Haloarcula laminariae TaxID=2961577 RepID=UPI0021C5BBB8|nr:hypothetical protein [Halomicroarcula laminariae]
MSEKITRRKLLRVGAGTAALGAVGSLSGCSAVQDLIPGGGGGLGSYTNWVYAPDTFKSDREGITGSANSYTNLFSNSDNLSEIAVLSAKGNSYPDLGINVEDVSMELNLPDGRVITGSFDTEAVKSELTAEAVATPTPSGFGSSSGNSGSTQYESDSTYNDYEIYVQAEPEESPNAIAVGDGTIIEAQRAPNATNEASPVSAPDVVEGMIDAGTEGTDRYVDSNDTFSTLTDTLNNGVRVTFTVRANEIGSDNGADENISAGRFDGVVAQGQADSINGDTTESQYVFVYDSEGDVNEGDIQEWIEANDTGNGSLSNLDDLTVSTDGNTATVTGTRDTLEYGI